MAIDKAIEYKMQGGKKPARNYLGKQKTVSNIPVKWKSGPDAPSTELAYITKAEKDLILKKNLHGSLKNGPNTGPDGIMSLDSQGDYTRDRSPAGRQSSPGGPDRSRQSQAQHEQHMREILTGQKNIGQTTKTGPKTKKYAVPEYVKVRQPGGGYKNKYIGSGYKSYGTPSFFGNLFSRGAPGYRGIKGMPAFFGKPGFEAKQGPQGFGYYSDKENFGEIRDAFPKFGLMGLISSLAEKFKKPKDMSEFNDLGLVSDRINPDYNDLDNELMLSTQKTPNSNVPIGTPNTRAYGPWTQGDIEVTGVGDQEILNELAAEEAAAKTGLQKYDPNNISTWYDTHPATGEAVMTPGFKEFFQGTEGDKLNPRTVYDSYEFKDTGNPFRSEMWQKPYSYDSVQERKVDVPSDQEIFNERFVDASSGSPYTSSQDALLKKHGYDPYGVGTWKNQEGLKLIDSLTNWNTRAANGGLIGYANGGLASLFTRRG